jgi:hypothetical protein
LGGPPKLGPAGSDACRAFLWGSAMRDYRIITIGARTQFTVKVLPEDYDFLMQWKWTYAVFGSKLMSLLPNTGLMPVRAGRGPV